MSPITPTNSFFSETLRHFNAAYANPLRQASWVRDAFNAERAWLFQNPKRVEELKGTYDDIHRLSKGLRSFLENSLLKKPGEVALRDSLYGRKFAELQVRSVSVYEELLKEVEGVEALVSKLMNPPEKREAKKYTAQELRAKMQRRAEGQSLTQLWLKACRYLTRASNAPEPEFSYPDMPLGERFNSRFLQDNLGGVTEELGEGVAVACAKGWRYDNNEDGYFHLNGFVNGEPLRVYGVCDGCGNDKKLTKENIGNTIVSLVSEEYGAAVQKEIETRVSSKDPLVFIPQVYQALHSAQELIADKIRQDTSKTYYAITGPSLGSTIAYVVIYRGFIFAAHAGDTKIIKANTETGEATPLTFDHDAKAMERKVTKLHGEVSFSERVFRVNSIMAWAKGLGKGDFFKIVGGSINAYTIDCRLDITHMPISTLGPSDELLIATDGFWSEDYTVSRMGQVLQSYEGLNPKMTPLETVHSLAEGLYDPNPKARNKGPKDNATVLLIRGIAGADQSSWAGA